jgi:hypothetical protein
MDVDNAFPYGEMPEDIPIYVDIPQCFPLPPEFEGVDPSKLVAKLNRALYGLKQAPRLWNQNFHASMISYGFTQSLNDPCLYCRQSNGEQLYVTLFVDDLIIAGSSDAVINQFRSELITNLGGLK